VNASERVRLADQPTTTEPAPKLEDSSVIAAVREYLAALEAGRQPDRDAFLARYHAIAGALAEVLDGLEFMHAAAPRVLAEAPGDVSAAETPLGMPLGDFRILREVGRGGMGVVYEAEQMSLGRRVALKVLPFASTLDPKQLQRFKNEAQAAAGLHHTNIVPVFATGCERGVHYYAMQYIEGQTLAQVIADLRLQSADSGKKGGAELPEAAPTGPYRVEPVQQSAISDQQSAIVTTLKAGLSTERSTRGPAFFRAAADLGVQAAQALEHAHQLGIVHRDIKPANLLVQGEPGVSAAGVRLWITDFGLAHCQSQAGLTMTGDLVGTLRYMSPEQALAQRVTIDHRTDVYSLGVTLYELLTLEPAFPGRDRQELLRQIAFEEPRSPKRHNAAIPLELETIVLKAMEKNPAERYATAQELADDLERFLKDEPIRAKRPTLLQRARKWARRHQPVVWSASACLMVIAVFFAAGIGWFVRDRAMRLAAMEGKVDQALEQAVALQRQGRWPEALEAVKRAEDILAGGASEKYSQRVRELRKDLEMVLLVERIRGWHGGLKAIHPSEVDVAYAQAFRDYGIDVEVLDPEEAAERIRARTICLELTLALDLWADIRRGCSEAGDTTWIRISAIAGSCDPDDWRNQVRDAWKRGDKGTLNKCVAGANISDLSTVYMLLGCPLDRWSRLSVLRQAQRAHPDDFEINFALGTELGKEARSQEDRDEVIRFYTAALALRPHELAGYRGLADALLQRGKFEEAIALYRKATKIKPESGAPQSGQMQSRLAQILADYPDSKVRDPRLAVEYAKEAVELAPQNWRFWKTLGLANYRAGDWEGAIAALERSVKQRSGGTNVLASSSEWFFLAMAHWQLGNHEEARHWYKQAVQWMDKETPQYEGVARYRAEAEKLLGAKND
jgi:serine/threonine protein kinase/cytochrome c-type biogenesis protein CcmH/NrfG